MSSKKKKLGKLLGLKKDKKPAKKKRKLEPPPVLKDEKKIKYKTIFDSLNALKDDELPSIEIRKLIAPLTIKDCRPLLLNFHLPVSGNKMDVVTRLLLRRKCSKEEVTEFENKNYKKNDKLAQVFLDAAETEDGFKANALRSAASVIRLWPEVITESEQLEGVKGIGKGSLGRIEEFLTSQSNEDEEEEDKKDNESEEKEEQSNDELQQKIMNVLNEAGGETVSLDDIVNNTKASKDDVQQQLTILSDAGRIYAPMGDDNYASAE